MLGVAALKKDPTASAPYQSLYHLRSAPFSATLAEGAFYADHQREQALDMLQHLTQYSEELLLLIGDSQVGKSALLERYLARAEEHWLTCHLQGVEGDDAGNLFMQIARCFKLRMDALAPDELLGALQEHLSELAEEHTAVLVVDDAQLLSDEALEIISHLALLEGEHGRLVRVVMAGEPALTERLAGERFSALPEPHRIDLAPFDLEGTGAYIAHRLAAAGYSGPELLNPKQVKRIHKHSGGLPGQINIHAHQALSEQSGTASHSGGLLVTSRNALKFGAAAAAVVVALVGLEERLTHRAGDEPVAGQVDERPIVRMGQGGGESSVAMVIRGGESVQITCGGTGIISSAGAAELPARAVESAPAQLGPMITELPGPAMELPPEPVPEAEVAEEESEVTAAESVEPVMNAAAPGAPIELPPPPAIEPIASEAESEPMVVAEAAVPEEKPEAEAEAEPEKVAPRPRIERIEPMPLYGSNEEQVLALVGEGFISGSRVSVAWAGKTKALEPERIEVINQGRVELRLLTGARANNWAVQLTTPEGKRSNIFRFKVQEPEEAPAPVEPTPVTMPEPSEPQAPVVERPEVSPPAAPKPPVVAAPSVTPPAAPTPAKAPTVSAAPVGLQGDAWLRGRNPKHLALQLLATADAAGPAQFAKRHAIPGPLASYTAVRDGKSLHILVQGDYADRASADAAIQRLPRAVRDGGPWPRSFASVQQALPAASSAASSRIKPGSVRDEAWVWSQDPGAMTVQLAAAAERAGLDDVAAKAGAAGDFAVVTTRRNGRPWYLLVAGVYADKDSARRAIEQLPQALRSAGPWSRSFASLQDEMSRSSR